VILSVDFRSWVGRFGYMYDGSMGGKRAPTGMMVGGMTSGKRSTRAGRWVDPQTDWDMDSVTTEFLLFYRVVTLCNRLFFFALQYRISAIIITSFSFIRNPIEPNQVLNMP
jgi:hypothetical protein